LQLACKFFFLFLQLLYLLLNSLQFPVYGVVIIINILMRLLFRRLFLNVMLSSQLLPSLELRALLSVLDL
jgi:hypothetical protein